MARQRRTGQLAQLAKDLGKNRTGSTAIGIRQGRAAKRAVPQVIMTRRLRVPHRLQLAQARQPAKLPKDQRDQMMPSRKALDVLVPAAPLDIAAKRRRGSALSRLPSTVF